METIYSKVRSFLTIANISYLQYVRFIVNNAINRTDNLIMLSD